MEEWIVHVCGCWHDCRNSLGLWNGLGDLHLKFGHLDGNEDEDGDGYGDATAIDCCVLCMSSGYSRLRWGRRVSCND